MKVHYVANATLDRLLDAGDALWGGAASEVLSMNGTPVTMQPTAAVRNSWRDKPVGATAKVAVRAAHNGKAIAFRLDWNDPDHSVDHGDNSRFPDAAAVAFPLSRDTPLLTMGAPGAPLAIWYWRADTPDGGFQVRAEGPGSTQIVDRLRVRSRARWQDGMWSVTIARELATAEADTVHLKAGQAARFGVAVWEGAHGERGGLKAVSGDWQPLAIVQQ